MIVSRGSGPRGIKWAASLGFIDVFGHKESLLTTVQKFTVLHDPIKQRTKLRSDLAVEFRNGLVTLFCPVVRVPPSYALVVPEGQRHLLDRR